MKHKSVDQRWAGTVRTLIAVDLFTIGVVFYLLVLKFRGERDVPSVLSLLLITAIFLLGSLAVFYFMRAIKNGVRQVTRHD